MSHVLPLATAFTGATVTEGQFKTAITDLREYLAETRDSKFSAYQTTNQAIAAATWTALAMQAEEFDDLGEFNTTTYEFRPTNAGTYIFSGSVSGSQGTTTNKYLAVYVNGVLKKYIQATTAVGGMTFGGTAPPIKLNASDAVTLYYYTGLADTTSAGATATYFAGYRLR